MTVTSNIHYGLSAWSNHTFALGERCSNAGNAYQCTVSGTSTAAPTGTFGNINNGGAATFKFLSAVSFASLQAWWNALPATLVDNVVASVWNNGSITTTAGTPYLNTGANAVTPGGFTITINCAPGESFKDRLRDNNYPLAFSTSTGVNFTLPAGPGNINYFYVNVPNVTIDGIQTQDPLPSSNCTHILGDFAATNFKVQNCILDGYTQNGGAGILGTAAGSSKLTNLVIVERGGATDLSAAVSVFNSSGSGNIVNCTIASMTGTGVAISYAGASGGGAVKNCAILGWPGTSTSPLYWDGTGTTPSVDHCVFSSPSFGSAYTDGGNNLYNKPPGSQVISFAAGGSSPWSTGWSTGFGSSSGGGGSGATSWSSGWSSGFGPFSSSSLDLRLIRTADCINAGATDTTDIPAANDIRGVTRPQSTSWDVGAWELVIAGPLPGPLSGIQQEVDPRYRIQSPMLGLPPPTPTITAPWMTRSVFTRQESPSTWNQQPSLRGPAQSAQTTLFPRRQTIFAVQELPPGINQRAVLNQGPISFSIVGNPWSRGWSSGYGPVNVGNQVAAPPQIGIVVQGQEPPPYNRSWIFTRVIQSNVTPPIRGSVFIPPQAPRPGEFKFAVFPRDNTAFASQIGSIVQGQEQPPYFRPAALSGPYGANVRPPVFDSTILRQLLPDHPLPTLSSGPVSQVVSANVVGGISVRQEAPSHPLPALSFRKPDAPPANPVLQSTGLVVPQAQPPWLAPVTLSSIQSQIIRPPVFDAAIVPQVQPSWLAPTLQHNLYGSNVRTPVLDTLLQRQLLPDHPLPSVLAGVQGPNVRIPLTDSFIIRQLQPDHPLPRLDSGVWPRGVKTDGGSAIVLRQEAPSHPLPALLQTLYGYNVRPSVIDTAVLRQELPWHPASSLVAGVHPINVATIQRALLVRQEQVFIQQLLFQSGVQVTTFVLPILRSFIGRQELPWHPGPSLAAGTYRNRPFVHGKHVKLLP